MNSIPFLPHTQSVRAITPFLLVTAPWHRLTNKYVATSGVATTSTISKLAPQGIANASIHIWSENSASFFLYLVIAARTLLRLPWLRIRSRRAQPLVCNRVDTNLHRGCSRLQRLLDPTWNLCERKKASIWIHRSNSLIPLASREGPTLPLDLDTVIRPHPNSANSTKRLTLNKRLWPDSHGFGGALFRRIRLSSGRMRSFHPK